jgi:hypothetical protein
VQQLQVTLPHGSCECCACFCPHGCDFLRLSDKKKVAWRACSELQAVQKSWLALWEVGKLVKLWGMMHLQHCWHLPAALSRYFSAHLLADLQQLRQHALVLCNAWLVQQGYQQLRVFQQCSALLELLLVLLLCRAELHPALPDACNLGSRTLQKHNERKWSSAWCLLVRYDEHQHCRPVEPCWAELALKSVRHRP